MRQAWEIGRNGKEVISRTANADYPTRPCGQGQRRDAGACAGRCECGGNRASDARHEPGSSTKRHVERTCPRSHSTSLRGDKADAARPTCRARCACRRPPPEFPRAGHAHRSCARYPARPHRQHRRPRPLQLRHQRPAAHSSACRRDVPHHHRAALRARLESQTPPSARARAIPAHTPRAGGAYLPRPSRVLSGNSLIFCCRAYAPCATACTHDAPQPAYELRNAVEQCWR